MTVYVSGRPVRTSAQHAIPSVRARLVRPPWRRCLPPCEVSAVAREALARVERLHTPPPGESFIQDGVPYSTADEFVDDLLQELRVRLLRRFEEVAAKVL